MPLPSMLALLSAFMFAMGAQFISLALRDLDSRTVSYFTILTSMVLYWLIAPFSIEWQWWWSVAMLIFASIGLYRPFLSTNLANAANKRLGPTLSTTLSGTTPFFAAAMGLLILDEQLTLPILLGTTAIVLGVILISTRKKGVVVGWPWWALLLPIGAAFFRALGNVMTKVGLEFIASPVFAGLVGYTSAYILAVIIDYRRKVNPMQHVRSRGTFWAVAAGTINGLSILSLNTALKHGSVIEVTPLVSVAPVFSLLLSWAVFRREALTAKIVLAVFIVVSGVIMITLGRVS